MPKEFKPSAHNASSKSEQTFFDDPVQDRMLALSMALANELWVAKCQIRRLEELLIVNKIFTRDAVEDPPSDKERAERQNALDSFSSTLMNALKGQETSKSPDDETLKTIDEEDAC